MTSPPPPPAAIRGYDASGTGYGSDVPAAHEETVDDDAGEGDDDNDNDAQGSTSQGEVRVVRNLSLKYFRGCLVEHFDILFHRHQVQWPARRADRAPTIAEV